MGHVVLGVLGDEDLAVTALGAREASLVCHRLAGHHRSWGGAKFLWSGLSTGGFSSENSSISRLTLLLGRRARVSEAFRHKLSLGGGSQFDTYFRAASGNDAGQPELDLRTTVRFLARAEARYAVVPETLALRPEVEIATFEIRRLPTFVGGSDAQGGAAPAVQVSRENDVRLRLFADVQKLSFGGLMPGAFVGLDSISVSGDAGSTSAVIPIFGVGLINAKPKE